MMSLVLRILTEANEYVVREPEPVFVPMVILRVFQYA